VKAEPKQRRKRKPDAARYIKQARKAGEQGPVRVEMIDNDGRKIVITSSNQPDATVQADNAEQAWFERIAKNAH
jgi:hypothetical protein